MAFAKSRILSLFKDSNPPAILQFHRIHRRFYDSTLDSANSQNLARKNRRFHPRFYIAESKKKFLFRFAFVKQIIPINFIRLKSTKPLQITMLQSPANKSLKDFLTQKCGMLVANGVKWHSICPTFIKNMRRFAI